jgi:CBS domain-containing protein
MLIEYVTRTNDVDGENGALVTVPVDANVRLAVDTLTEHGIGILPVCTDDGSLAGLLSQRDILRGLARYGPGALDMLTADLMTTDVVTCSDGCAAKDIVDQMAANGFRHMPIVENGKPLGMISSQDIITHLAGRMTNREFGSLTFWV